MKGLKILTAACLLSTGAFADALLYWGSDEGFDATTTADVFDRFGDAITAGSSWLVELRDATTEEVIYSTNNGFDPGFVVDGQFYIDGAVISEAYNGSTFKTVVYDASTAAAANYTADFSVTPQLSWSWSSPSPPTDVDYLAGGVSQGDWQAIPEPAVAGLIGLFGGGMLLYRRLFSKA